MIQIQPVFLRKTEYENFSEAEGFFYEALELSFDGVSPEKYNWYKTCKRVNSIHGAFIDVNPASGLKEIAQLSQRLYEVSCEQAIECDAKNVVFHSTCFPFLRGYYLDSWAEKTAESYTLLAEKYPGLNIFIENSFDIDPGPMKRVMDLLSVKNVEICLDIGHINYSRASVESWFDSLGNKTGYLHLSDNNGVYDDHIPLGDGTVDWKKAEELCSSLKKDIPVTLEVGDIAGIKKSVEFLNRTGYFSGRR